MIDLYGGKCSKCGWNEIHPVTGNIVLIVHHKDGDYRNSQKDNLDVLCPNHHSLTENYGSLNNGRGRDYRYLRKNAPVV
jgi:predicted restriction endonuclease